MLAVAQRRQRTLASRTVNFVLSRQFSSAAESVLSTLRDFEKAGVPSGASGKGEDGFDLGRMHRLLEDLNQPQMALKAIHIAGTKGKGSVAAMLSSILFHAGYKVGMYTSPHVVTERERIAIDLQPISQGAFDSLVQSHAAALSTAKDREHGSLSRFEALTALAIKHFADQQVDAAVVEAGLGGLRDATNVFDAENLELAVLTAVGLEHQKALGDTIEAIAESKAGICRQGRPVIIGHQQEANAMQTLASTAEAAGSLITRASETVSVSCGAVEMEGGSLKQHFGISRLPGGNDGIDLGTLEVDSQLIGQHQGDNAATAVTTALQLAEQGWSGISQCNLKSGLEAARLPGRFQIHHLGDGKPWVVLDGAHTPASAAALSATLKTAFPGQPLAFIVAMANDKDHAGVLAALRTSRPDVVVFTSVLIAGAPDRVAPPGMLAAHWQAASFSEEKPLRSRELLLANMASALDACKRELFSKEGAGVICVTGSLHAVGAALKILQGA